MAGWVTEALDAFQLDYLFVKIRKKDGILYEKLALSITLFGDALKIIIVSMMH